MKQMTEKKYIRAIENGKYEVTSFTDPTKKYIVDPNEMTCTCPAFVHRQIPCKHIDSVLTEAKKSPAQTKQIYTFYSVTGKQFEIHSPYPLSKEDMQFLVGGEFELYNTQEGEVLCVAGESNEKNNPFFPTLKGNVIKGQLKNEYFSGWK